MGKLPGTNVFTTGSKNLKSSAIAEHVRSKLTEYSLLTVKKKISLDNNSLEIQAKSSDFILNPDQQLHSQIHPTELQVCQCLALAAVTKSKHSLLQLSRQNGSRLCWSRNLSDTCSMTLYAILQLCIHYSGLYNAKFLIAWDN